LRLKEHLRVTGSARLVNSLSLVLSSRDILILLHHAYNILFFYPANISASVYNKWHETELERWLSDHNVPYPTPADRKDLENLVKNNWQSKAVYPYHEWDTHQLHSFLKQKGVETKDAAAANHNHLLEQVKAHWYDTEEKAEQAWANVKDWIFDT
jgi:hypothetical protein